MNLNGNHYHYNLSTRRSEFANGSNLTPGKYRITVTEPALDTPLSVTIE